MSITLKYDRKINKSILVADIISSIVLLLLLYTALSKIFSYEAFKLTLANSPLLKPFAGLIGWLLPVAEISISVLLFFPSKRLVGLWASAIIISLFTLYLGYMVLFTPSRPCNCGGVLQVLTWSQHIFFNVFFIALSVTGIILYKKDKLNENKSPP